MDFTSMTAILGKISLDIGDEIISVLIAIGVVIMIVSLMICLSKKGEEEAEREKETLERMTFEDERVDVIGIEGEYLSSHEMAILYYCARNIIYDKYEDKYIQIVTDKKTAEELANSHPDWELCYPSKELLEKVSKQIMQSDLFKKMKETGGFPKPIMTREERARSFSEKKRASIKQKPEHGGMFLYKIVEKCEKRLNVLSEKFKGVSAEEIEKYKDSHDIDYKDYLLKKTWLESAYKVPEGTYLETICEVRELEREYITEIREQDCLSDSNRSALYKMEGMINNKEGLLDFVEAAKMIKCRSYSALSYYITRKKEEGKMDGIALMLYPMIVRGDENEKQQ